MRGVLEAAPARQAPFSILGRTFHAPGVSSRLLARVARDWHFAEHDLDEHAHQMRISEGDLGGIENAVGLKRTTVRLPGAMTLDALHRGGEWRFRDGKSALAARFDDDRTTLLIDHRAARAGSAKLDLALYLCLNEALRVSGLIPLHAAVIERGGVATALAAPSGTGKTTTLLHLIGLGWRPLAEDLAWLDPVTMMVYGWDRGVRIWDDGVRRLPGPLEAGAWQTHPDGKRFLPWSEIEPPRVPAARLTRLVLLDRDDVERPVIAPLAARDAVRALWEATGVPFTPRGRRAATTAIDRLVRSLQFSRIRLGSSPADSALLLGGERIAPLDSLPAESGTGN